MSARRMRYLGAFFAGSAVYLALPGLALAQEEAAQVDEIVVTAQKRTERLEDVPISVTAATGEQLEKAGVTNVQDIAQITVGVNISRLATFIQPTIRGITSQTGAPGQDNNVAVYIDGVYQASSTALNQDLVSVKSMQVLKGPQGTLFGRNSTAGAILIETLDPSFTPVGKASASYGRFNDWTVQGYYSAPLVDDKLAFDLAVYYRKSDGFIKDIARDVDAAPIENTQFRSKLLFTPNEDLKVTLTGVYNVTDDPTNSTRQVRNKNLVAASVPGTPYATRAYEVSHDFQQETIITTRSLNLNVEYDLGWATLKSITSGTNEHMRLTQDNDGTALPRTYAETRYYYNTLTQEVNLGGSSDKLDWVLGGFYLYQHGRSNTRGATLVPGDLLSMGPVVGAGTGGPGARITGARSKAAAVYADGTYRITDKLALIGGLRYSYEKKTFEAGFPLTTSDPLAATAARPYMPGGRIAESWSSVTPRAVLRYEVAPDTNVYASFSKGFKSGTYPGTILTAANPPGVTPSVYVIDNSADPEKVTAYEVGFKTAQGRWRLNAAAFYYDYKDMQVQAVAQLPAPLVGSALQLTNAASSTIKGVEIEGSFEVTDNLTVRGGAAWTRARYKDFTGAPAYGNCPISLRTIDGVTALWDSTGLVNMTGAPNACVDATRSPAGVIPAGFNTNQPGVMDRSGDQMIRAPEWTFNLAVDYTYPTSAGDFTANVSASYSSSFSVTDLTPVSATDRGYRMKQPAYTIINAQLTFQPAGKDYRFSLWGKNLGNEVVYGYPAASQYGDTYSWVAPLTWGVKFDYEF